MFRKKDEWTKVHSSNLALFDTEINIYFTADNLHYETKINSSIVYE